MSDDLFSIDGRRVVITGGTAGIGLGVAEHFVGAGARVVVTGRRANGAEVAASIQAGFVPMDVSDDASVEQGLARAAELLGGLDVLILNAGIWLDCGSLQDYDLDAFRRVLDVNLGGVMRGIRFGLAHLERGGVILVTSSPMGRVTAPGDIAYGSSKAALDLVVHSAALELAPQGIRVTGVLPGFVDSEMGGGAEADVAAWLAGITANRSVRTPIEMGPVYQYLASPAAALLHGSLVAADDGFSAGLSETITQLLHDDARARPPGVQNGSGIS